jgi:hypothetical protein
LEPIFPFTLLTEIAKKSANSDAIVDERGASKRQMIL